MINDRRPAIDVLRNQINKIAHRYQFNDECSDDIIKMGIIELLERALPEIDKDLCLSNEFVEEWENYYFDEWL